MTAGYLAHVTLFLILFRGVAGNRRRTLREAAVSCPVGSHCHLLEWIVVRNECPASSNCEAAPHYTKTTQIRYFLRTPSKGGQSPISRSRCVCYDAGRGGAYRTKCAVASRRPVMLFCSLQFFAFFSIVLVLYWLLRWQEARVWLLL